MKYLVFCSLLIMTCSAAMAQAEKVKINLPAAETHSVYRVSTYKSVPILVSISREGNTKAMKRRNYFRRIQAKIINSAPARELRQIFHPKRYQAVMQ